MFLDIPDLLTADECARLAKIADSAKFVDGRISSPHATAKNNLQIDYSGEAYAASSSLLAAALHRSEPFRNFAFPRFMAPPMLARYEPGMKYGAHSDAAFMEVAGRQLRSDLSCTIFLTDPASYRGGELSIRLGDRTVEIKMNPGAAVVYPSTTLHEVRPVTEGRRLVGITFIQSQIADPARRELLYDLNEVAALEGLTMRPENRTRLQHVRTNLLRRWADAV